MNYDVIVIGGGSAGLTSAIGCVKLNKKTLLIERNKLGGECTWGGCIPSKAFINLSKTIQDISIFKKIQQISEDIYAHETPEVMKNMGIDVIKGQATFKNANEIVVNDKIYRAKIIIIATGSSPMIPPIPGLEQSRYLTNNSIFHQTVIPKSMVFIGAGVISLELAIPMSRLGTKVTILEKFPNILPQEDTHIREKFYSILKKHHIELITETDITSISSSSKEQTIHYKKNGQEQEITTETIFISAGRKPNVEQLDLDKAGINYSPQGIIISEYLKTNIAHIYAIGDVTNIPFRFSHVAGLAGETLIRNLILPFFPKKFHLDTVPFVIFSDPEYSHTGYTQSQAEKKYGSKNIKIYTLNANEVDRSIISLDAEFHLKVICYKGKIVGALCMGERAGEIIAFLQYLKNQNLPFYSITKGMQAYPTYGDTLRKLAKKALMDRIFDNPIVKLFVK